MMLLLRKFITLVFWSWSTLGGVWFFPPPPLPWPTSLPKILFALHAYFSWNGNILVVLSMSFHFYLHNPNFYFLSFPQCLLHLVLPPPFISTPWFRCSVTMHYEPATPTCKYLPSPPTYTPSSMGIVVPKTTCGGCRNAYYPIRVKIPSYRRLWQNWDLSLVFLLILPSLWLILRQYNSSWDASLSITPVPMSVEASLLGCRKYLKTPLTGMEERIWSTTSKR